jgi:hypothetical protein
MSNDLYAITDIQGYAAEVRKAAADSLSSDCEDNLDEYINISQMINLVKNECVGFDDNNRPLLNEDANEKIYISTVTWIQNVGLARLAAQNLVECAWDNDSNEMVFWANPEIHTSEKKKRKPNDKSSKSRNKKKD